MVVKKGRDWFLFKFTGKRQEILKCKHNGRFWMSEIIKNH